MKKMMLKAIALTVTLTSPGLAPYAAAQQIIGSGAAAAARSTSGAAAGAAPDVSRAPSLSGSLNVVPALAFSLGSTPLQAPSAQAPAPLAPAAVAAGSPQPAAAVLAPAAAAPEAPRDGLVARLVRAAPETRPVDSEDADRPASSATRPDGLLARLASLLPKTGAVDFDGTGKRAEAAEALPAGDTRAGSLLPAAKLDGARRYYVYETVRDNEIGKAGTAAHYSLKTFFIGSKVTALALASAMVASVYAAIMVLVPVKLAFFINFQTKLDHALLRPWLSKRAPIFSSRREVFTPSEELAQIPGVLKTIDASTRSDSSYGFLNGFLGAFKKRRVETFRTLAMTDRPMPAEILAQDGALLGRMTEVGAGDALVFRARGRHGPAETSWKTTTARLFAGDAVDAASAAALRSELGENWLRDGVASLLKLSLAAGAILGGGYFGLGLLGVGAHHAFEFSEIAAITYFILIGVYEHSNGHKVYERYFGKDRAPGSFWSRLKGFLVEAWKESVSNHEPAVSVERETAAGPISLGEVARGVGVHALAGNGLRRQLVLLAPWILAAAAAGIAAFVLMPSAAPAALLGLKTAGVLAALSAAIIVPSRWLAERAVKPGLKVRSHQGLDPVWTAIFAAGLVFGGLGLAAAAVGSYGLAVTWTGILVGVAIVLDPFSTGAKAYDTSLAGARLPLGRAAFLAAALGLGALFLAAQPAALFLGGEALIAAAAVLLIGVGEGLRHFIDPGIKLLRTPRSTPALAGVDNPEVRG